ncbi:MAG: hypothetical protein M0R40_04235 [Firmicutes bacterium]|nr:hypothetical protein [Bacillota bacterium]
MKFKGLSDNRSVDKVEKGIATGESVVSDSSLIKSVKNIILEHVKKIQNETGMNIKRLALDAGYDVGAVHRGLEILGITGYVSCIDFSYDILRRSPKYMPEADYFSWKNYFLLVRLYVIYPLTFSYPHIPPGKYYITRKV